MPRGRQQRQERAQQSFRSKAKKPTFPSIIKAINRLVCLVLGLSLPAAAQEQVSAAGGLCQSMGPQAVMAISGGVLFGVVLILGLIYWRLQRGGWSLANAVSEPTHSRFRWMNTGPNPRETARHASEAWRSTAHRSP